MQLSNLAARMEVAVSDLPKLTRPALQVITNPASEAANKRGPRMSLTSRKILIRDQGYRSFRIF